jgi:TolB-like protein
VFGAFGSSFLFLIFFSAFIPGFLKNTLTLYSSSVPIRAHFFYPRLPSSPVSSFLSVLSVFISGSLIPDPRLTPQMLSLINCTFGNTILLIDGTREETPVKNLKAYVLVIVFSLGAIVSLAAFEKIPIAIMDFKVTNFQKTEFDLFLDFFSNSLFETGVFDVLQRDKRDKLMQEIQFSMSDTADAKKTRQVGKLLSSKLLVFGNLGKVGKNVLLSVSIIDVETGRTVSTYSKTYKSLEEVFDSLTTVSNTLADPAAQSVFLKMTSVLYFDDFEQEKWGVSEKLFYKDGKYHIFSKDGDWYVWQAQSFDDFSMECEVTLVKGTNDGGYGLIFRLLDENNFYLFQITSKGYCTLYKNVNGNYTALLPMIQQKAINLSGSNQLKVTAFRNRISLFINNVKVKDIIDTSFREGKFGLYSAQNDDIAFDNLIIYQGNLVFYDYFNKPSDNFAEGKMAYTKDGSYKIDNKAEEAFYYTWITEPRKNISFKAETVWREGDAESEYGISFRIIDVNNNYGFMINKNGYYFFGYFKNGAFTPRKRNE